MGLFGGKKKTKEHDANSVAELLRLAEQYDTGNGVSMDRARATELYEQAAGMGDAKAQEALGGRYEEGVGTAVDLDRALFWYEQAVSGGRDYAAYSMGYLYYQLEKWDDAFQWAMIAANMENTGAKNMIGRFYYYGIGTVKDIAEAVNWWESAAREGDTQAARFVASVYHEGELGTVDLEKAYEYYKLAADAGDSIAYVFLGDILSNANFSGFNIEQAISWYEKGSCEHFTALVNLYLLYKKLMDMYLDRGRNIKFESLVLEQVDKMVGCKERMVRFPNEKIMDSEKNMKQHAVEDIKDDYSLRDTLRGNKTAIFDYVNYRCMHTGQTPVTWEEYNR